MNDDFKIWFIKYLWPSLNTVMFLMLFFYLFITKDINTQSMEKVEYLEMKVENQEKLIDLLSDSNKPLIIHDTIIIVINDKK